MNAIVTKQVRKKYNTGVLALDQLNLTIKQGEVFTLLGKNRAGKSTLISLLTTFKQPSSGTIEILNQQVSNQTMNEIRRKIACVAQTIAIDEHLTLMENRLFQSRLYKITPTVAIKKINQLITTFELTDYLDHPIANYSGGIKRRLDIAINLVIERSQQYVCFPHFR
ncbi:ATP-binding cassette domain-containing protein [Enterococcus sp. LJL99]